jgi:hypothetical protein
MPVVDPAIACRHAMPAIFMTPDVCFAQAAR